MNTISPQILSDATISALERTAMVMAEPVITPDQLTPPSWFARIDYRGPRPGSLILGANDQFLRDLAAGLIGVEPSDINVPSQGADALKELANILAGSVILAMSGDTCKSSLGLPEIIVDTQALQTSSPGTTTGCAVVADEGSLQVWLTENTQAMAA